MERKEVEIIERFSPKEVSDKLKINPSTLRKYSNMITKEYGKEYFQRDVANYRLYTPSDLALLKRVIEIKNAPGFTLEKAIEMALSELGISNHEATGTVGGTKLESEQNGAMRPFQEMNQALSKQSADIASFLKSLHEQIEKQTQQIEKQNQLAEQQSNEITELVKLNQESAERQNQLAEQNQQVIDQNQKLAAAIEQLQREIQQAKEEPKKGNWLSNLFHKK